MKSLKFPQLETKRLLLRQLKSTDAEAVHRYLSDPDVTRYLATPQPIAASSRRKT